MPTIRSLKTRLTSPNLEDFASALRKLRTAGYTDNEVFRLLLAADPDADRADFNDRVRRADEEETQTS